MSSDMAVLFCMGEKTIAVFTMLYIPIHIDFIFNKYICIIVYNDSQKDVFICLI